MIDIIPKLIGAKVDAIGLRDYFGKMSNIAHFKSWVRFALWIYFCVGWGEVDEQYERTV